MCVLGTTNINWMLYNSCKLTQSLSANPGLHAKHVHGKTKKVSTALSAEPSVATGLPWSQHSATVGKRGGPWMNSCQWKHIIVCLTLWSSYWFTRGRGITSWWMNFFFFFSEHKVQHWWGCMSLCPHSCQNYFVCTIWATAKIKCKQGVNINEEALWTFPQQNSLTNMMCVCVYEGNEMKCS